MKKLLIAAAIGALSSTLLVGPTTAFAQSSSGTAKKAKHPAPKHRLPHRRGKAATVASREEAVPEGSEKWSCKDGLAFWLKGDLARDQVVTVHWASRNYQLPRETTSTGAERFHDSASGLDLVVIPLKAMLFSDNDGGRLADQCRTVAMEQGTPAPMQPNTLNVPTGTQ